MNNTNRNEISVEFQYRFYNLVIKILIKKELFSFYQLSTCIIESIRRQMWQLQLEDCQDTRLYTSGQWKSKNGIPEQQ